MNQVHQVLKVENESSSSTVEWRCVEILAMCCEWVVERVGWISPSRNTRFESKRQVLREGRRLLTVWSIHRKHPRRSIDAGGPVLRVGVMVDDGGRRIERSWKSLGERTSARV